MVLERAARQAGNHVVLDMAMSQYSYGTLSAYASRAQPLPFPGGFNSRRRVDHRCRCHRGKQNARSPSACGRAPGLALTLDLIAAMLAGGQSTHQIARDPLKETGLLAILSGH